MDIILNHSAFKNAYFMSGNVMSPFQYSTMIRSKVKPTGYNVTHTLERLVAFDLKPFQNKLPSYILEKVRKNALNGISQTVYIIHSGKTKDSFGRSKKYGAFVLDNTGKIILKHYFVRGYKANNVIDTVSKEMVTYQKERYEKFKAEGREHQLLS